MGVAVGGGQLPSTVVVLVISITHGPKGHLYHGIREEVAKERVGAEISSRD